MIKIASNQRQIFNIYNGYRIVVAFIFLSLHWLGLGWQLPENYATYSGGYSLLLILYLISAILITMATNAMFFSFTVLVVASGIIDLIFLNVLVYLYGGVSSGAGILINVSVAAFSIMLPGRLAILFASLASFILLILSSIEYLAFGKDTFFYVGIHGVGLFATAVTALVLANWVQASERLASKHSKQVKTLQSMNDFIIQRLNSGIVVIDERNRILMLNEAAGTLFYQNKSTWKGRKINEFSPELATAFAKLKQNREANTQLMIKNSKSSWQLLIHCRSIINNDTYTWLIIIEDMAKTIQKAQQLKLASLGRFTASIAHELRNPLGAISHATQLLEEKLSTSSAENRRLLEIIDNNSNRMNNLIKNILQLSRRGNSEPISFTPYKLLAQVKKEYTQLYNDLGISINIKNKTSKFYFDKAQFLQVLFIFLENTSKHAKSRISNLSKVELIVSQNEKGYSYLLIKDNGPGIKKVIEENIFEPFCTTSRTGVDLGLFIAKEICEANQAYLNYLPDEKGTCFKIVFNCSSELLI